MTKNMKEFLIVMGFCLTVTISCVWISHWMAYNHWPPGKPWLAQPNKVE